MPTSTASGGPQPPELPPGQLPQPPTHPRRRGRETQRVPLSVEGIVAAAISVLETDGVAALSMRAVATRLRTGPASLYVYVANKEELLELVFDELVSRVAIPPAEPANWQQQLRQVLIDLRTVLRTHSAVALAGLGRIPISAKSLVNAEGVLAIMHAGGLPPRVTALGADLLALYVIAGVFEDSLFDRDGLSDSEIGSYVEEISEFYRALPADQFPTIALLSTALTADDGEARFLFGLDVLIAGLVTLGERETKAADRPPEAL